MMNYAHKSQSELRQRRARVARELLLLQKDGKLAPSEQLTWDALDASPEWCGLTQNQRASLQRICGAMLLAPIMKCWIDRREIKLAHSIIGESVFVDAISFDKNWVKSQATKISDKSASNSDAFTALELSQELSVLLAFEFSASDTDSVDKDSPARKNLVCAFDQAGAAVLNAASEDQLPTNVLRALLVESSQIVDQEHASVIVDKAYEAVA